MFTLTSVALILATFADTSTAFEYGCGVCGPYNPYGPQVTISTPPYGYPPGPITITPGVGPPPITVASPPFGCGTCPYGCGYGYPYGYPGYACGSCGYGTCGSCGACGACGNCGSGCNCEFPYGPNSCGPYTCNGCGSCNNYRNGGCCNNGYFPGYFLQDPTSCQKYLVPPVLVASCCGCSGTSVSPGTVIDGVDNANPQGTSTATTTETTTGGGTCACDGFGDVKDGTDANNGGNTGVSVKLESGASFAGADLANFNAAGNVEIIIDGNDADNGVNCDTDAGGTVELDGKSDDANTGGGESASREISNGGVDGDPCDSSYTWDFGGGITFNAKRDLP